MSSPTDDVALPHPPVLHLVKQVQYKAYLRLETVLQPLGITAVQFRILTTLSSQPGLSSAALARLYDVKPQTMIKQIAALESKDLIERVVNEDNKRRLDLSLTDFGHRTLAQCHAGARAVEGDILDPLSEADQSTLAGLLMRVLENLDAETEGDRSDFAAEEARPGVQRVG